jgi:hypothetical protein
VPLLLARSIEMRSDFIPACNRYSCTSLIAAGASERPARAAGLKHGRSCPRQNLIDAIVPLADAVCETKKEAA